MIYLHRALMVLALITLVGPLIAFVGGGLYMIFINEPYISLALIAAIASVFYITLGPNWDGD